MLHLPCTESLQWHYLSDPHHDIRVQIEHTLRFPYVDHVRNFVQLDGHEQPTWFNLILISYSYYPKDWTSWEEELDNVGLKLIHLGDIIANYSMGIKAKVVLIAGPGVNLQQAIHWAKGDPTIMQAHWITDCNDSITDNP